MASKKLLLLGLLLALVLYISSDVVSAARTDPAGPVETKGVQAEGLHHEEDDHHHHHCHHHHCDEKDNDEDGGDHHHHEGGHHHHDDGSDHHDGGVDTESESGKSAEDGHHKKRCKHWPHC